ncbi:hypothetical protein CSQ96_25155 [Janthinobacterium sp. BJB412]|jgi:hypothetical protein|nr:hypothetical protein CSQ96_25155 [Janthinobacterium sp. BJB412]
MEEREVCTAIPNATLAELGIFLHQSGSTLSPTEAVVHALKLWMETQQKSSEPPRGYQWKCLFLPHGSQVRMFYQDAWEYASVRDDELIYRGYSVSPHQMALEVGGKGRNAWRDLWVQRPADQHWRTATELRNEHRRRLAAKPNSPMEAMTAAARCMSDTLKSALLLVEQANHQTAQQFNRRQPKHRRYDDHMIDACMED